MREGSRVRLVVGVALAVACVTAVFGAGATQSTAPRYARTLYLIRHGAYDVNAANSSEDGPSLTALGIAQARLVAARLADIPGQFESLTASTMTRARETAAVIRESLPKLSVRPAFVLRECTPRTSIEAAMREVSAEEALACEKQLNEAFAAYFVPAGGRIQSDVLVCHGNVIRYFVTKALGVDTHAWLGMSVAHASMTVIQVIPNGTFKVLSVGDIGHIPPHMQSGIGEGENDPQGVLPRAPSQGPKPTLSLKP